jgi:hypothetical protein
VLAGRFTVYLPKATPGEHFEGLDLLTVLLSRKTDTNAKLPSIEVIGETPATGGKSSSGGGSAASCGGGATEGGEAGPATESPTAGDGEEPEIDWEIDQPLPSPTDTIRIGKDQGVGCVPCFFVLASEGEDRKEGRERERERERGGVRLRMVSECTYAVKCQL